MLFSLKMSVITMLLQTPFTSSILLQSKTIHYASPKYSCSTRLGGNVEFRTSTSTREYIKPSSPTPHHRKTYKLSVLDQLTPPLHMPLLLFYPPSDASVDERLVLLKTTLSETLTRFYPLAGRIKNQYVVDCNDDGALYIEVKIRREMMDCLQPPKNELLHELLPCQLISEEPLEITAQVAVQANVFACGGIALAICCMHKLVDGATFGAFLKAWAQIARGSLNQEVHNVVDNIAALLFPANELCSTTHLPVVDSIISLPKEGKRSSIMKRFAFDSNAISMLREKARSERVQNPTPTEVISGIIWKCAMNAYKSKTGHERSSAMTSAVNLRRRLKPRLPHHSIGNIMCTTIANYDRTLNMNIELLPHLVSLLRNSIHQVNTGFFTKLQGEGRVRQLLKSLEEQNQNLYCATSNPNIVYAVTSLSKMGFYEIDFGWGKPLWVTIGPSIETSLTNTIFQVEARNGNGIEALIVLEEDEMEILVNDQELRAYATLNSIVKP